MARSQARIFARIWTDPDFTALPADAQWLYFVILSQPGLSLVGVLSFTPRRWSSYAQGMTEERVVGALAALVAGEFVLYDAATEELFVRTLVKNDGVLASPKVVIAARRALEAIVSPALYEAAEAALSSDADTPPDTPSDGVSHTPPDTRFDTPPDTDPEGYGIGLSRARAGVHRPSSTVHRPSSAVHTPAAGPAAEAPPGNGRVVATGRGVRDPAQAFDALWAAWPQAKRRRPADTRRAFNAALAAGATPQRLLDAAHAWGRWWAAEAVAERYIPRLDNWLRDGDWAHAPPTGRAASRDAQLAQVLNGFVNGHDPDDERGPS